MDPESLKLAEEIEASRQEIEKLQERVRQLVARRGKRAELVKSATTIPTQEIPEPANVSPRSAHSIAEPDISKELTIEEGLAALRNVGMAEVRLIAFKHGAIILLFANEKTLSIRMDDRGPKPLLDLLTANDQKPRSASFNASGGNRPRA